MKVSYRGLGMYIDGDLPTPESVADLLNTHAFEVEEMVAKGSDTMIDVDVLPDRAHYALSHYGVALELACVLNLPMRSLEMKYETGKTPDLSISIEDEAFCPRYIGRRIENVTVGESQEWVKSVLEAIDERSINSVVDATNFIMLGIGQPMHAFDADKVVGGIMVRKASEGEKITLLDGTEVELNSTDSVIADDAGPLAIAGVKGGKRAEVTMDTKRVILESAKFDPVAVRSTSRRLKIINNSSKRFENGVAISQTDKAMDLCSALIKESSQEAIVGTPVIAGSGSYTVKPVEITHSYIEERLGGKVPQLEVLRILKAIECGVEEKEGVYTVTPAEYRRDLTIPEDIVEEVGRLYGYAHITGVLPEKIEAPAFGEFEGIMALKQLLAKEGFYEVFTSSFRKKGDVKVIHPVAKDKAYLRTDLRKNMEETLEKGVYYKDYLGLDLVRVFEIGKTFKDGNERQVLCIGVAGKAKEKVITEALENAVTTINTKFGLDLTTNVEKGIVEIDITEAVFNTDSFVVPQGLPQITFNTFSQFPFVTRDIAVFTPAGTTEEEVAKIITDNTDDLLVKLYPFDRFEKDGQISYAFRLVFQSKEKTLTDDSVNALVEPVHTALNAQARWQVR